MGGFTPRADLDEVVARMIADSVSDIVEQTLVTAKELAPATKRWRSQRDEFVRDVHVAADAKAEKIPVNLRFKLTAYAWDIEHPGHLPASVQSARKGGHWLHNAKTAPGRFSYLLEPRDPTQGHYVQTINCRCTIELDPRGVAKLVKRTKVTVTGTKVTGTVYAEGKYVMGAEYGDVYPGGLVSPGTFFMQKTVAAMGARGATS